MRLWNQDFQVGRSGASSGPCCRRFSTIHRLARATHSYYSPSKRGCKIWNKFYQAGLRLSIVRMFGREVQSSICLTPSLPRKWGGQCAEWWIPVFTGMTGRRCAVACESLKTERPSVRG